MGCLDDQLLLSRLSFYEFNRSSWSRDNCKFVLILCWYLFILFAFADYLLTERGDKETLWIGSSKEFSHSPLFFFLSQLISSHICCCCECVCVDKSFFPFGQQKFGSTLRHCVAWESGKSVKSGRDVRFFCGAELLCERRRRRRRRHAGCSGLAARANHPQPLGRSWIAFPSWRYELIRLYRLLFLFYFFSILKQSSIATKSPSPVFCVVFWAGTDGRKKIIWKREKEEDKKETNKLEKYVL